MHILYKHVNSYCVSNNLVVNNLFAIKNYNQNIKIMNYLWK